MKGGLTALVALSLSTGASGCTDYGEYYEFLATMNYVNDGEDGFGVRYRYLHDAETAHKFQKGDLPEGTLEDQGSYFFQLWKGFSEDSQQEQLEREAVEFDLIYNGPYPMQYTIFEGSKDTKETFRIYQHDVCIAREIDFSDFSLYCVEWMDIDYIPCSPLKDCVTQYESFLEETGFNGVPGSEPYFSAIHEHRGYVVPNEMKEIVTFPEEL